MGFKLDVPPIQPTLGGQVTGFHGFKLVDTMEDLPNLQGTIALLRDGFSEESQGGTVELDNAGKPILDYPLTDYIWKGLRKAHHVMAELQFAAGAKEVMPLHHDATFYKTLAHC
jgi:hypothetical protein